MLPLHRAVRQALALAGAIVFLSAGTCGDSTDPANEVASVQITAAPTNPRVGETIVVFATPVNSGGVRVQGVECTYISSAPGVAASVQLGPNASVTGISVGSATITATCAGKQNSVALTIRPPLVTLTLTRLGSGPGGLFASPAGLSYDQGTAVTVTQVPVSGSVFMGWGDACTGTGACVVQMTGNRTVTGTFDARYAVTTTIAGTGTGTISASPSGLSYALNTPVTLTAVPAAGSGFTGWSGDCSGTGTCQLTMTAAKAVTANFTLAETFVGANASFVYGNMASATCTFTNSMTSGKLTLVITSATGGALTGTASGVADNLVTVASGSSCTGGTFTQQPTGTVTGSGTSVSATTANSTGRFTMAFSGTRSGSTITGTLTINAIFTITDFATGVVTDFPFTKAISPYVLTRP